PKLKHFMNRFGVIRRFTGGNSEIPRRYFAVPRLKNRGILRPSAICPLFFRSKNSENSGARLAVLLAPHSLPRNRGREWVGGDASVDQAVEFAGVLAGDLVHNIRCKAGELLLDIFRGFRPDAVGVRVIGAPHHGLDTDVVDELCADRVELERRLALAAPI